MFLIILVTRYLRLCSQEFNRCLEFLHVKLISYNIYIYICQKYNNKNPPDFLLLTFAFDIKHSVSRSNVTEHIRSCYILLKSGDLYRS
jgi:hypothetical protein